MWVFRVDAKWLSFWLSDSRNCGVSRWTFPFNFKKLDRLLLMLSALLTNLKR